MNTLSKQLSHIGQLTQTIISQPNDPLYSVINKGNGMLEVKPTKLAKAIENVVEQYLYEILEEFPIYEFHPFVSVFIRNAIDCNLISAINDQRALMKSSNIYQVDGDYQVMLDLIMSMKTFIQQILDYTSHSEFKELICNVHRASKKNHDGMMRYIDSLFEHYSRLVVIRLDLYEDGPIMSQSDIQKKYWQAKHDFRHLLNNARMYSLFDARVGYIWSLEYGPERGFHYHLVLFFDGSQVRDDVYLAREIGEYWLYITKSRGDYWNCNANKEKYGQLGIGTIHYSDLEKINCLKQAAAYLVKVDHYVRMLTADNGRTFGRGEILPPRTSTVGRPRAA
ncbi:YagK/YfjJ domain-containing protein [Methylomonas koyamae]|uniref:YagK/YfjJ domain-containing protein n=1 Tax=Methylomonas koyamae TaxID=702114 RepID=UPI000BC3123A|nr:inovirus-type Gp2 protein [Methylomonas koyamae]ATG88309.1 hypothetical protein MKLM6_0019 [Methylomonas koyamae]